MVSNLQLRVALCGIGMETGMLFSGPACVSVSRGILIEKDAPPEPDGAR
jgi:hypothetical protein